MILGKRVYVIAEAGINHNNTLDNCYKLIDTAVASGCECVKFQFFTAEKLYPHSAGRLVWGSKGKRYSYDIFNAVKSFELPKAWIKNLIVYCRRKKINFLASVFDEGGVDYLLNCGVRMIKISSYSITNIVFIEHCARYKIPIIMSTGGASLGEIEEAVGTVNKYHNKLAILHCSIKYPTNICECNLGVIETLRYAFPHNIIGYSDHTKEISSAPVQAVYLGAKIIEKHITLDRNMSGPDHFFALEPQQLRKMVQNIHLAEKKIVSGVAIKINKKLYGSSQKVIFDHEEYLRDFCYSSIFAARFIKRGERILAQDLRILRNGKKLSGIAPKFMQLFKRYTVRASRDIDFEEVISWGKIFNA